jgi:hypothetical protein
MNRRALAACITGLALGLDTQASTLKHPTNQ